MKKEEELKMLLDEVLFQFKKENYNLSVMGLEKAGKFIIKELNNYNNKH